MALNHLSKNNKWLAQDSDGMISLKNKLSRNNELFGQYKFKELIAETKVGERYVYRIYMLGYERQPLDCRIIFYKPGTEWQVQNITFSHAIGEDIAKQADQNIVRY